jgi:hypothetical protein
MIFAHGEDPTKHNVVWVSKNDPSSPLAMTRQGGLR